MKKLPLLVLLAAFAYPIPSYATYHFMKIRKVFAGTTDDPTAQFIELQMYAGGQHLVGGKVVHVYDAAGTDTSFTFASNVSGSATQSSILIATTSAQTLFDITADLTMTSAINAAGGKICFADPVDCFAWGSFAGADGVGNAKFGTKFGALPLDLAVVRKITAGNVSLLEDGDDTDDSAADFEALTAVARNNAGATGALPTDCGNGDLDTGEECDDGNTNPRDACTATCQDAACGDGVARNDLTAGNLGYEACDDGNSVNTDGCRNDCLAPSCGDGLVSVGEQCDPPAADACDASCFFIFIGCGDGDLVTPEQCDDGNTTSGDGCRSNCTTESCGDGIKDASEGCDDGNSVNTDGCTNVCALPSCGDGNVDADEDCDDANTISGDGCDADCTIPHDHDDHDHDDDEDDSGCANVQPQGWAALLALGRVVSMWRRRKR